MAAPARRGPGARRKPDRARRLAFDALRLVNGQDAYANLVLADLLAERHLEGRDAAFATELVAGTCRLQGTYDAVIVAASGRSLGSLQPAVLDLLRLGAHQVLSLRVPGHAAVAAMVDLAAATVGERVTGLTNAVLRRVAAHDLEEWLDLLGADLEPRDALALRTAHPRWVVDAFADVLSDAELAPALEADNVNPAVTLVVRPGLAEVDELVAAGAEPAPYSPFAARWSGNPAALPAVRDGRAGVQDEGSQLVAWGLTRATAPTGPWLDLCSGPGGKAALLAGLLGPADGLLLAVEPSAHRAALVATGLRAHQPGAATVLQADGTRPAWRAGSFARVIADVPCTGLGALRRRPEARWRRADTAVEQLHELQCALLASALDAARPGGVVAYVTCSPHRRETVDVVTETLAGRDDVAVLPAAELLPELPDAALGDFLQLWPHRHGTDAMFAAYLRVG
ncbi:transcription antitermination factor NusB [Microlunatus lacustris]